MIVKAKRLGWDEVDSVTNNDILDPYDYQSDDLIGEYETIKATGPYISEHTNHLVGWELADPTTIIPVDNALNETRFNKIHDAHTGQFAASAGLTSEQYNALYEGGAATDSSDFNQARSDRVRAVMSKTEPGAQLLNTLDDIQKGDRIPEIRQGIARKYKSEEGKLLVHAINNAPTENVPSLLVRGLAVPNSSDEIMSKYEKGSTMTLNVSSFSSKWSVADGFINSNIGGDPEEDDVNITGIQLNLKGKKRGLPTHNLSSEYAHEREWLTAGEFKVTNIKKSKVQRPNNDEYTLVTIDIEQIGTL